MHVLFIPTYTHRQRASNAPTSPTMCSSSIPIFQIIGRWLGMKYIYMYLLPLFIIFLPPAPHHHRRSSHPIQNQLEEHLCRYYYYYYCTLSVNVSVCVLVLTLSLVQNVYPLKIKISVGARRNAAPFTILNKKPWNTTPTWGLGHTEKFTRSLIWIKNRWHPVPFTRGQSAIIYVYPPKYLSLCNK